MLLSLDQYNKREHFFKEKYKEYIEKLIAINKSENSSNREECKAKRKAFKEEYAQYNRYDSSVFTELSGGYIITHPNSKNAEYLLKVLNENKGKQFIVKDKLCTLNTILVSLDDYYYKFIKNDSGWPILISCCVPLQSVE